MSPLWLFIFPVGVMTGHAIGEHESRVPFHHLKSAICESLFLSLWTFSENCNHSLNFWKCTALPQNRRRQPFLKALPFGAPRGSSRFILKWGKKSNLYNDNKDRKVHFFFLLLLRLLLKFYLGCCCHQISSNIPVCTHTPVHTHAHMLYSSRRHI